MTPSSQPSKVLAYLRVSSEEQARSGAGIAAQRARIEDEAARRGWDVDWVVDDGYSASDLDRPGITEALGRLQRKEATALVVSKLDRLSRSLLDFARLLEQARSEGWGLVLLDVDLDTTKPSGRLVAHVMAAVADWERERIRERTTEALAAVRARGTRLGRPPTVPVEVRRRIVRQRRRGLSYAAIADRLTRAGVPTAHGGSRWWPSTVRAVAQSAGK